MTKCKRCKGTGLYPPLKMDSRNPCKECEGTGVVLRTVIEEQFDDAAELDGTKIYPDEIGYIQFEEEDYEL